MQIFVQIFVQILKTKIFVHILKMLRFSTTHERAWFVTQRIVEVLHVYNQIPPIVKTFQKQNIPNAPTRRKWRRQMTSTPLERELIDPTAPEKEIMPEVWDAVKLICICFDLNFADTKREIRSMRRDSEDLGK